MIINTGVTAKVEFKLVIVELIVLIFVLLSRPQKYLVSNITITPVINAIRIDNAIANER